MTDSLQSLRNFHRAPPKIGHHLWRLPKAFEWKVSRMWHFWPSWLYSKSTNYIRGLGPSPALSIVMDRLSTSVPSWTNGYQARNRAVGMYYTLPRLSLIDIKVNSVQEACSKCFAVHMLEFEILQITWKKWNKEYQTLSFQFIPNKFSISMFLFCFFMWFARFQVNNTYVNRKAFGASFF